MIKLKSLIIQQDIPQIISEGGDDVPFSVPIKKSPKNFLPVKARPIDIKNRSYVITKDLFYRLVTDKFNIGYDLAKDENKCLYRGSKRSDNIVFVNPPRVERTSKDSKNIYYVLLDNLPSWKNYPKRSKSIIFTNQLNEAMHYGSSIYKVIPKNDAKIVVALYSEEFIYMPYIESRSGYKNISLVSYSLNDIIVYGATELDIFRDIPGIISGNYKPIIDFLDSKIFPYIKKNEYTRVGLRNGTSRNLCKDIQKNWNYNTEEYLDELFDPLKNKIELLSVNDAINKYSNSDIKTEMWTDSFVIMVRKDSGIL